jgi:hypothetical protein
VNIARLLRRVLDRSVFDLPAESTDLLSVLTTTWPQAERLAAAERVLALLGPPIHPRQWPLVAPAFRQLPPEERHLVFLSGIFASVPVIGPLGVGEHYEPERGVPRGRRMIWRRLNKFLVEELSVRKERRLPSGLIVLTEPEEEPRVHSLEPLLASVPPRVRELLQLLLAGRTVREAAAELGIAESTVRVMIHQLRRKARLA